MRIISRCLKHSERAFGSGTPALRRLLPVLALCLWLGSSSVQASQPDYIQEPGPSAVVVQRVSLTPDRSAADVRIEAAIEFIQYANGATEIAGSVTYDADGPPLVIEYDLQNKTYGFRSPTAAEAVPESGSPIVDSSPSPDQGQLATIIKSARARVAVQDPVNIVVSETTNALQWYIYDNATVSAKSHTDHCYANPSTPINTIWYTRFCDRQAPVVSSDRKSILNQGQGNYENWNWMDPNKGTWSYTTVNILGTVSGSYTNTWNCVMNGENGSLLKCQLFLN